MKKSIYIIALFFVALIRVNAQEKIEVALSQPGKAYSVELGLIQGSIKVVKHSAQNLIIETTSGKKASPATKDGMRKISGGGAYEITVEENANKIKINTGLPTNNMSVTLSVPAGGSFNLKTINNGNIQVDGVAGEFELSNINGQIILNNISGSVVASTINGDIKATFDKVTPNTPMAFSTLNGKIDLNFPSTVKMNIKARTDQGDIFSDFEIGSLKSSPKVVRKNENGYTKIEASEWVTGTINGGGAETMLKSFHGDIYIRKGK
jgi:hypothetical protein